jgi:hypothetical protein
MKKSVIENQFKEKMNAREIVPSKASWDRLDAMLTVAEKPKSNFKWMYVAASFLGFLLLGALYFNENQKEAIIYNNEIVVNEPTVTPEIDATLGKTSLVKRVVVAKGIEKELVTTEVKSKVDSNSLVSNTAIQVAEKEIIQEPQISIINQKAEQKIVLRKSNYVNVDELLAAVDPLSKKKNSSILQSSVKVNSNELLTQVDGELELSFREKALKVVNQKIKTATVALSNRNSE